MFSLNKITQALSTIVSSKMHSLADFHDLAFIEQLCDTRETDILSDESVDEDTQADVSGMSGESSGLIMVYGPLWNTPFMLYISG